MVYTACKHKIRVNLVSDGNTRCEVKLAAEEGVKDVVK
jgi:hypothetical protein